MGVLTSSTYIGLILGIAGGAALANIWGWRWAFIILAAPGLPCALLLYLIVPGNRRRPAASDAPSGSIVRTIRECWRIPSLRLLAIGIGTFNIFAYAGAVWMPAYFIRSHGMSLMQAGAWLGIGAAAGGFIGSLASGRIVDAFRGHDEAWQLRVPALGFILSLPLYMMILLLPGGSATMIAGHAVPNVALLSLVTAFFSAGAIGPAFGAIARLVPADRRAQATAFVVVIINVMGSMFGPLIAGLVSDGLTAQLGEEALRYSLLSMSALVFLGGWLLWRGSSHYLLDVNRAVG